MGWVRRVTFICDLCCRLATLPLSFGIANGYQLKLARKKLDYITQKVDGTRYDLCPHCQAFVPVDVRAQMLCVGQIVRHQESGVYRCIIPKENKEERSDLTIDIMIEDFNHRIAERNDAIDDDDLDPDDVFLVSALPEVI